MCRRGSVSWMGPTGHKQRQNLRSQSLSPTVETRGCHAAWPKSLDRLLHACAWSCPRRCRQLVLAISKLAKNVSHLTAGGFSGMCEKFDRSPISVRPPRAAAGSVLPASDSARDCCPRPACLPLTASLRAAARENRLALDFACFALGISRMPTLR